MGKRSTLREKKLSLHLRKFFLEGETDLPGLFEKQLEFNKNKFFQLRVRRSIKAPNIFEGFAILLNNLLFTGTFHGLSKFSQ